MNTDNPVDKHYRSGDLLQRIMAGLELAGANIKSLVVDDLAPVDAFHTRGRSATAEIAEMAMLEPSDRVLDVGCGMGGTARHLAVRFGCQVVGIDLSQEYIAVGLELTRLVGLEEQVKLVQGSVLKIPYDDASFDVAWTEHVQMNITDKFRFYSEIARVLKPGGRLLFHDIFQGPGVTPIYPTPWAEDESISSLVTESVARSTIEGAGLIIDQWLRKNPESISFFKGVSERIAAQGLPPLGIHLLMGDTARVKLQNLVQNLEETRVSISLGIARKPATA